jgi:GNAT superfamily N-acetyltransferase
MSDLPSACSIRPATNADIPAVRELVFSVLAEFGLKPDPAATDADLSDIRSTYFDRGGRFDVLVNATGGIVGSGGLYAVDRKTVELRKMYLRAEVRGKGQGKRLLDRALAEARRMGFRRMTLETAGVLKAAVAMYERYGFRPYKAAHCSCRCDQTCYLDL